MISRTSFVACITLIASATALTVALSTAPAQAAVNVSVLPDDADRALVVRTCTTCHPPELVVSQRRTEDEWDAILSRMVDHGAVATSDEQDKIYDYLVKYFNKAAPAAK